MSRYAEAFKNLAGPGDSRPTALQIVKDEGQENNMQDKVSALLQNTFPQIT
jgi:hypothetical protein